MTSSIAAGYYWRYPPCRLDGRVETAVWRSLFLKLGLTVITNFYIDGFNLYYRALRGTPFRWLDLRRLAETLFPDDEIHRICYFTALLTARPDNPGQPLRQLIYLRALGTLPGLEIYYGDFRSRVKLRRMAEPAPGLPEYVRILDSEEKGTDVNLATRLLVDGFKGDYEQAVIISNDSDLAAPIRYVHDDLNRKVSVVNPDNSNYTHRDLVESATYSKRLRKSHLRRSRFPSALSDAQGQMVKPNGW